MPDIHRQGDASGGEQVSRRKGNGTGRRGRMDRKGSNCDAVPKHRSYRRQRASSSPTVSGESLSHFPWSTVDRAEVLRESTADLGIVATTESLSMAEEAWTDTLHETASPV